MSEQLFNVDWGDAKKFVPTRGPITVDGLDHPGFHRVLSFVEAASFVGVSKATLERLVAGKRGPPVVRLSTRRCGFRLGDLIRWVGSRVERAERK